MKQHLWGPCRNGLRNSLKNTPKKKEAIMFKKITVGYYAPSVPMDIFTNPTQWISNPRLKRVIYHMQRDTCK